MMPSNGRTNNKIAGIVSRRDIVSFLIEMIHSMAKNFSGLHLRLVLCAILYKNSNSRATAHSMGPTFQWLVQIIFRFFTFT